MPNDKGSRAWVLTELFVLLAEHDRIGLVQLGGPRDEYDVEAGQIVRRVLGEGHGPRDVERIVAEVFEHYFGEHYAGGYADVSERIWSEVQRAKVSATRRSICASSCSERRDMPRRDA